MRFFDNPEVKYEILDHPADLKIRTFGKTKEELFKNALFGMEENMKPEMDDGNSEPRNIKIRSSDFSALLADFLAEILYQIQTNKEIYDKVDFKKFTDPSANLGQAAEIEAEIFGKKVKRFAKDVKAVTYHDLDVCQNKDGGWEAVVLFDI